MRATVFQRSALSILLDRRARPWRVASEPLLMNRLFRVNNCWKR